MAAAARQDDQGNLVQVGDEGEEGEHQDTEGWGPGDERGWGAPNPREPWDPPYGGAHRCHPLDPLPPDPMNLLGNLVDALQDAGLQANPGHRWRYQQALCRCAYGGVLPDPDLNPDSDDDDTPRVNIPPPIFKGLPGERPDAHIYATEDWMEAMHFREDQYIDKFKHTLNHLAWEWYHSLDRDTFHGDWEEFTKHFSRYFSTQGQNIKHLHER